MSLNSNAQLNFNEYYVKYLHNKKECRKHHKLLEDKRKQKPFLILQKCLGRKVSPLFNDKKLIKSNYTK